MIPITMDSKEIKSHLTPLSNRLAEAIGWVSKQEKKITFNVPDNCISNPRDGGCLLSLTEAGRTDVEILIGILKIMGAKPIK